MTNLNDFSVTDDVTDNLASYHNRLLGGIFRAEFANTETISATKELTDSDCQIQYITASGSNRTVELPPEASTNHLHIIYNSGSTYSVVIKDDAGSVTFATLAPDEFAICYPLSSESWRVYTSFAETLYKINVSLSTNDLVVSVTHLDGSTPTVYRPIMFVIGTTKRYVTSALSITIAAGTNWFGFGDAQKAVQLVPCFTYVLYDSNSSAVALTIGAKPYYRLVSETSATTTNESHIYGYSGFTSTDEMENIGYFEATLSATPGFTWTVPTFTSANLKNYPVYETRDFTFVPQWTNLTVGNGTLTASYKICYRTVMGAVYMLFGSTSSISGGVSHTIPFSTQLADTHPVGILRILDASAVVAFSGLVQITSGVMALRALNIVSTYLAGANLSSTVPMTWTTSDLITHTFAYPM